MTDIENKIENEEKLTDEELEKVAGGSTKFYSISNYEGAGVVVMNGGKKFYFEDHDLKDEGLAASITFYWLQHGEDKFNETLAKGWDTFKKTVTNYSAVNQTTFKNSYLNTNPDAAANAKS